MRKEFDESELLLEKKEKQMYCHCLIEKQPEDGWVVFTDQGYSD